MDESRGKAAREEYVSRINRVLDYIESHLDADLSLQELAAVAGFSRFHFHRLFHAMVGETLNQFIQRVRVEKAASSLIQDPRKSITEVALACGFSSSSTFARSFKELVGMSASEWRAGGHSGERRVGKADRKNGQTLGKRREDFDVSSPYIETVAGNLKWRIAMTSGGQMNVEVEVKDLPEMHVAYVRHVGPYKGDSQLFERLFGKLMAWAGPRGLLRFPETKMLTLYHDDPEITDEDKLRISVCISVPEDTAVDGEIGKMAIPGGRYAVAHFELSPEQYQEAWEALYQGWLPQSGYQPGDSPAFELYLNDPREHPEHKQIVDICVPVKPL
jgi:AraC family transcriptional regulator